MRTLIGSFNFDRNLRALAVALAVGMPISSLAQGTAFTYQGRLADNATPAHGTYDLRFRLASDPLANNYVAGNVFADAISVTNGLFTVPLDFGVGIFTGSNLWLEVDVRTNGGGLYTMLSPLQALTPSPYAIMSGSASNLLGELAASQLSGAIPSGQLSGVYSGTVNFNNPSNMFIGSFTGNGAGLTNVNATTLAGQGIASFWQLGGNNVATGQFLGSTNNQPIEFRANNIRALQLLPTTNTANFIGGDSNNFVAPGVYGATIGGGGTLAYPGGVGLTNKVLGLFATIGGGVGNTASGTFNGPTGDSATVGGGWENSALGNNATVGGGAENIASGDNSAVGGGFTNLSTGPNSSVGGGRQNTSSGLSSTIAGGIQNTNTGTQATIGGGALNVASGLDATIAGGVQNVAVGTGATVGGGAANTSSNFFATVPGGNGNVAGGNYSFAAGGGAHALHTGAFVWADGSGGTFDSTANYQFLIRASGGVGIGTTSPSRELEVQSAGDTEIGIKSADTNGHLWTIQSSGVTGSPNLDGSFQIIDRTINVSRVLIGTNGNFGIHTRNPQTALDVNGAITATNLILPATVATIFSGSSPLLRADQNFGSLYAGNYAGGSTSSGFFNTGVGEYALFNNAGGGDNTAVGTDALSSNLSGSENTALGTEALNSNTTGVDNTAVGSAALFANSAGSGNTAVGFQALPSNSGGNQNTAIGVNALLENAAGNFNTAVGYYALESSPAGSFNIAVGAQAGGNLITGSNNIYVGNLGGSTNESGIIRIGTPGSHLNTFIAGTINGDGTALTGVNAAMIGGVAPTNLWSLGGNNVAPGQFLGSTNNQSVEFRVNNSPTLTLAANGNAGFGTAIPSRELEVQRAGDVEIGMKSTDPNGHLWTIQSSGVSNNASLDASFQIIDRNVGGGSRLLIGTNGLTGIGTTSPQAKLHVNGSVVIQGAVTPSAAAATNLLNLGSGALADGFRNGISFFEGGANTSMSLGYDGTGDSAHNAIRIYNASDTNLFTFQANGNMGIGLSSPTNRLHVLGGATFSSGTNGSDQNVVWVPGSAAWSFTSDRNRKERITPVNTQDVLEKVSKLSLNEWSYIGYGQRHIGPMAQDFHAAFPLNDNDTALNDADLHGVALAAIQGLNQKMRERDSEIRDLRQSVKELELAIQKLTAERSH